MDKNHIEGTAGQGEIAMRFDTLTRMADKLMMYKYLVKNVARKNGLVATFMPKPLFGDNGSGMHTHLSIWKEGKPLFFGNKPVSIAGAKILPQSLVIVFFTVVLIIVLAVLMPIIEMNNLMGR